MKNSSVLEITSGSTSFFSCEYRPGATNAHTWYSTTGSAIRNAAISRIFSGTRKGEITEVAISVAPLRQVSDQRRRQDVVQRAGSGPDEQHARTTATTAIRR